MFNSQFSRWVDGSLTPMLLIIVAVSRNLGMGDIFLWSSSLILLFILFSFFSGDTSTCNFDYIDFPISFHFLRLDAHPLVRGLVLLNCAGGMNNKAIVDDWRIKLLLPLLWFIDFLLKQKGIASFIFERIIREPALEEGAVDAFVSIVTGPPGPNPVQLMPNIKLPVLILWGDEDPFTPLDGPVGKYFSSLPSQAPNISLYVLQGVGHCPHDDRPKLVHEKLVPWLATVCS